MDQAQVKPQIAAPPTADINAAIALCADDMLVVDKLIRESLDSDVVLIRQIAEYIIGSGGKRLRPMLVVLSAHACGYKGWNHITLAAVIEFIHTATLLHDDVVDESDLRRGRESAHAVWGNAASVLVGDFLYSRAFEMMVDVNSMLVMDVLSHATNRIAEGEVEQLLHMHDPEITAARYFSVTEKKTAKLFEAACQLGAVVAGRSEFEPALAIFGRELGAAFQVADDVLDYASEPGTLGKNVGVDLAEGKPTLPLILCRERVSPAERQAIDSAIRAGDASQLPHLIHLIRTSGALDAAMERASERAQAALDALAVLPESPWKRALADVASYSVSRRC